MKKKHWITIGIFVVAAALLLLLSSSILCVANEKDATGIYGFFLEPEDSIDVVLIGSSSVYTGFYSPLAYEQQGFTSYSLSTSTMTASLFPYAAKLAIETQHPDVLVFETWSFCYEDQHDETSLRKFIDALPPSDLKNQMISELVPEELQQSFRFPFEKYHSSWDRFGELLQVFQDKLQMRSQGYSITKNFGTTPFRQPYMQKQVDYEVSEEGFQYLEQLLAYLQEADIDQVLFIRSPDMVEYNGTESYKRMVERIREAGFDFVNLSAAAGDMGIDVGHDYYNTTHFNVFGAEKFTTFLADYIAKCYQVDITHDPEVTKEWEQCASHNQQVFDDLKNLTENDVNGFLYTQRDFLG